MAVKIKLKRLGKIREPYYRIIVADARTKRDGRAIEEIGKYHPKAEPSFIEVNSERAQHWLSVGAQPTDPVRKLLEITGDWQKFKGLPGTEGTLRTAAPKQDRKEIFAAAAAESLAESGAKGKGRGKSADAKSDAKSGSKAEKSDKGDKPGRQAKADAGETSAAPGPAEKPAEQPAAEAAASGADSPEAAETPAAAEPPEADKPAEQPAAEAAASGADSPEVAETPAAAEPSAAAESSG